jgi:ATP-dependent helicase IRC3
MPIELRDYQVEAVEAVEAAWQRGLRRPLIALPTGTGKTIVFAEAIRRRSGRSLVLAHREELLQQARDKLALLVPRHRIGLVRAESDEIGAPIVVASVQTLARPERLQRLEPDFELVVVDEAHHATAPTYRRVLARFEALALGCTATPERADKSRLADVWDEIVYRRTLPEMIRAEYLCDLRAKRVAVEVDLDSIHQREGDWDEGELETAMLNANAPGQIAEAIQEFAADRKQILVFTPGVELAHDTADACQAAGFSSAVVDYRMPRDQRAQILAGFSAGEIRLIANCGILTEGYDAPAVDCLVLARPTRSRVLYAQMIGRGTRRHAGKADCLVLDVVGNTERHDLVTVGSLFGFDVPEDTSILALLEHPELLGGRMAQEASGDLIAREVKLFDSRFHWACGDGLYVLAGGDGQVAVRQTSDGWEVWHVQRDSERLVASGLDLEYAQGTAEDLVRRLGSALARKEAGWRQRPVSDRTEELLEKLGLPVPPTQGEASDLLSLTFAARALEPVTPRQSLFLRRQGVDPAGLLKRQASRLIRQRLAS